MGVVFISLQSKVWMFCPSTAAGFCSDLFEFLYPGGGECWIVLRESLTKIADRSIFFSSIFLFFCCRCHILGTFLTVEFRTCIWGLLSVLISPNPFCNCAILFASWGSGCEIKWLGGGWGGAEH